MEFDLKGIITTLVGILAASAVLYAVRKCSPLARRWSVALWRHTRQTMAADCAAAKTLPLWLKMTLGLMLTWSMGGVLAYALTGGMDGAAPVWLRTG